MRKIIHGRDGGGTHEDGSWDGIGNSRGRCIGPVVGSHGEGLWEEMAGEVKSKVCGMKWNSWVIFVGGMAKVKVCGEVMWDEMVGELIRKECGT